MVSIQSFFMSCSVLPSRGSFHPMLSKQAGQDWIQDSCFEQLSVEQETAEMLQHGFALLPDQHTKQVTVVVPRTSSFDSQKQHLLSLQPYLLFYAAWKSQAKNPPQMSNTGDSQKLWLETEVEIEPEKNTQLLCRISVQNVTFWACSSTDWQSYGHCFSHIRLSGLYFSGSMYCTQDGSGRPVVAKILLSIGVFPPMCPPWSPPCLLQGFRRFTYYLDRPDVMSKFTSVRLEADESKCPILQLDCERTAVTILGDYLVLSTMDMLLLCGFHSGCKSTLCDWVWSLASEFERSQESEAISFAATGLQVISFELFFVSFVSCSWG